ncbi:MAG: lipoyl synthase [Firmicutes bacterium]|nr:lipoyl synthase [Bacillota bacterium]
MRDRLPDWLRNKSPLEVKTNEVREVLRELNLNTVCYSARCPNRGQCYGEGTATFLILGDVCTRNCRFCAVAKGLVQPLDPTEPERVLAAVKRLNLRHVVITSVTRDDLLDGGTSQFIKIIRLIKENSATVSVEVLTPDFKGDKALILSVAETGPDIYNHNLETVPSLYERIRPEADYRRSLKLLQWVKEYSGKLLTKSGIMVGLGENRGEVEQVLDDLRAVDCDILTIGQYLQPTRNHLPVEEYVRPETFEEWRELALEKGFKYVASGPLVRSSFHAGEAASLAMDF